MTRTRAVLATLAVFVVAQLFGILIHGIILAGDYRPYYGTLLRPMEGSPGWQALFLPVSHLMVATALVWVAALAGREGSVTRRGLRLGAIAWLLGPAPMYLLWYAEQPWPGSLPVKQLPLEFAAMVVLGLLAARLTTPGAMRS
ncbi:MAG TPA: hypothetical protein VNI61_03565 [Gemmatimonadales bacterium]|nr:hypothetical protein [Gemmatimonadales bacterium]